MPIAVSVRRALASEATDLAELVNRAYEVETFFADGPRTSPAEIVELSRHGMFLVLEHEGGLAAAVYLRAELGDDHDHAYIGMLSVHPDHQGMGLGTRLVRIAEALGEAMGATTVGLKIVNLREELGRWYRSLGYQEVGTQPYDGRPTKQPCHFVELRRSLGEGGEARSTQFGRERGRGRFGLGSTVAA